MVFVKYLISNLFPIFFFSSGNFSQMYKNKQENLFYFPIIGFCFETKLYDSLYTAHEFFFFFVGSLTRLYNWFLLDHVHNELILLLLANITINVYTPSEINQFFFLVSPFSIHYISLILHRTIQNMRRKKKQLKIPFARDKLYFHKIFIFHFPCHKKAYTHIRSNRNSSSSTIIMLFVCVCVCSRGEQSKKL